MADQAFEAAFAIAIQSALGTPNIPAAWLTTSVDYDDGLVLGDGESGDAETGITFPEHVRVGREPARLGRTAGFDTFLRQDFEGLSIAYTRKGNGATTTTPAAGEAQPLAGIDALNRALGLTPANGVAPTVNYAPASNAEYATVCIWVADRRFIYQDCIVSSRVESYTPGDAALITDNIAIGSLESQADGVTFPTLDYGTQSTLSSPVIQGVANTFGTARGFESLEITIEGNQSQVDDSNQPTGKRQVVGGLDITAVMRLYLDDTDTDFEYEALISGSAPASSWSFQVGTAAGAAEEVNAFRSLMPTPQVERRKEDKTGSVVVLPLTLRARASASGAEYQLRYN